MGLLTAQLLARGGAARLAVVDRKAERLPIAEQLGATLTATEVPRRSKVSRLNYAVM
jgi:threonine dehydrogenase-like Zn-dependent dehydrogenase